MDWERLGRQGKHEAIDKRFVSATFRLTARRLCLAAKQRHGTKAGY